MIGSVLLSLEWFSCGSTWRKVIFPNVGSWLLQLARNIKEWTWIDQQENFQTTHQPRGRLGLFFLMYSLPIAQDFNCHPVAFVVWNGASNISTCWETAELCTATRAICLASSLASHFCGQCSVYEYLLLYGFRSQWLGVGVVGDQERGQTEDGWAHFISWIMLGILASLGSLLSGQHFPLVCHTSFPNRFPGVGRKTTPCSVTS